MLPLPKGAVWQIFFLIAVSLLIREAQSEGRVVCYYTNWSVYRPGTAKFNPQNINPYLCTHLIYAFGGFTKDNTMKPFDKYQDIEQGGYSKFTGLKSYNKKLKTMIAIGGWNEGSSRFSPLVASPERRQKFIKNILKFLRQNHFDGLDLDWEYPAYRDGGKPRDRDNYAQFVEELRSEFDRESSKTGRPRLLLTMAVPAGTQYIEKGYDIKKLNKYLDWFNILSYDYHSAYEPSVNHHAPLYSLEEESEYNYDTDLNIDYTIKFYLQEGADKDKLVLGIPTYGRTYTLINEDATDIGSPADGPGSQGDATREKGYLAYYEICQNIRNDGDWTVVQPNTNAMGPYAYRGDQWVGYDDEDIVRKKAEFVADQGLGGIMFWSIDNDDFRGECSGRPYPLIEAAKEAMLDRMGLGDNEVARPSQPKKPARSRSRLGSSSNRNRVRPDVKEEKVEIVSSRKESVKKPVIKRKPSTTRKTTTTTTTTETSLYIGGRTTTPAPPTTPDPGADFKCEEEGFFAHPRDCKKYFWCLDSGPSNLGIVAHQFTCPSGLYFNTAADSCDFTRNVPCKKNVKTTTVKPITTTKATTTTTTASSRVTSATSRNTFLRRPITSTTTTTEEPIEEYEEEYEDDADEADGDNNRTFEAEEDPRVIKELIELIKKAGGLDELEKQLHLQEDGSIVIKNTKTKEISTTPSTISKSLYAKVLNRPKTFQNRFSANPILSRSTEKSKKESVSDENIEADHSSENKYSAVIRNSRISPQNAGLDKLPEFEGFLREKPKYVTISRTRPTTPSTESNDEEDEQSDEVEYDNDDDDVEEKSSKKTTSRPTTAGPSYVNIKRTRPTTSSPIEDESSEIEANNGERSQTISKSTYQFLNRNRPSASPENEETTKSTETSSRYKTIERTRASSLSKAVDNEEETADELSTSKKNIGSVVTVQYSDLNEHEHETQTTQKSIDQTKTTSRLYSSIGRRTTITTPTPTSTETSNIFDVSTQSIRLLATENLLIPTTATLAAETTTSSTPITRTTRTTFNPDEVTVPKILDIVPQQNEIHTDIDTTRTTETQTTLNIPSTIVSDTTVTDRITDKDTDTISFVVDDTEQVKLLSKTESKTNEGTIKLSTVAGDDIHANNNVNTISRENSSQSSNNSSNLPNIQLTSSKHKISETESSRIDNTKVTLNRNRVNSLSNLDDSNLSHHHEGTTTQSTSTINRFTPSRRVFNTNKYNSVKIRTNTINRTGTSTETTTQTPIDTVTSEFPGTISSPRPFGFPRRRTRPTTTKVTTTSPSLATRISSDNFAPNSRFNINKYRENDNDNESLNDSKKVSLTTSFNVAERSRFDFKNLQSSRSASSNSSHLENTVNINSLSNINANSNININSHSNRTRNSNNNNHHHKNNNNIKINNNNNSHKYGKNNSDDNSSSLNINNVNLYVDKANNIDNELNQVVQLVAASRFGSHVGSAATNIPPQTSTTQTINLKSSTFNYRTRNNTSFSSTNNKYNNVNHLNRDSIFQSSSTERVEAPKPNQAISRSNVNRGSTATYISQIDSNLNERTESSIPTTRKPYSPAGLNFNRGNFRPWKTTPTQTTTISPRQTITRPYRPRYENGSFVEEDENVSDEHYVSNRRRPSSERTASGSFQDISSRTRSHVRITSTTPLSTSGEGQQRSRLRPSSVNRFSTIGEQQSRTRTTGADVDSTEFNRQSYVGTNAQKFNTDLLSNRRRPVNEQIGSDNGSIESEEQSRVRITEGSTESADRTTSKTRPYIRTNVQKFNTESFSNRRRPGVGSSSTESENEQNNSEDGSFVTEEKSRVRITESREGSTESADGTTSKTRPYIRTNVQKFNTELFANRRRPGAGSLSTESENEQIDSEDESFVTEEKSRVRITETREGSTESADRTTSKTRPYIRTNVQKFNTESFSNRRRPGVGSSSTESENEQNDSEDGSFVTEDQSRVRITESREGSTESADRTTSKTRPYIRTKVQKFNTELFANRRRPGADSSSTESENEQIDSEDGSFVTEDQSRVRVTDTREGSTETANGTTSKTRPYIRTNVQKFNTELFAKRRRPGAGSSSTESENEQIDSEDGSFVTENQSRVRITETREGSTESADRTISKTRPYIRTNVQKFNTELFANRRRPGAGSSSTESENEQIDSEDGSFVTEDQSRVRITESREGSTESADRTTSKTRPYIRTNVQKFNTELFANRRRPGAGSSSTESENEQIDSEDGSFVTEDQSRVRITETREGSTESANGTTSKTRSYIRTNVQKFNTELFANRRRPGAGSSSTESENEQIDSEDGSFDTKDQSRVRITESREGSTESSDRTPSKTRPYIRTNVQKSNTELFSNRRRPGVGSSTPTSVQVSNETEGQSNSSSSREHVLIETDKKSTQLFGKFKPFNFGQERRKFSSTEQTDTQEKVVVDGENVGTEIPTDVRFTNNTSEESIITTGVGETSQNITSTRTGINIDHNNIPVLYYRNRTGERNLSVPNTEELDSPIIRIQNILRSQAHDDIQKKGRTVGSAIVGGFRNVETTESTRSKSIRFDGKDENSPIINLKIKSEKNTTTLNLYGSEESQLSTESYKTSPSVEDSTEYLIAENESSFGSTLPSLFGKGRKLSRVEVRPVQKTTNTSSSSLEISTESSNESTSNLASNNTNSQERQVKVIRKFKPGARSNVLVSSSTSTIESGSTSSPPLVRRFKPRTNLTNSNVVANESNSTVTIRRRVLKTRTTTPPSLTATSQTQISSTPGLIRKFRPKEKLNKDGISRSKSSANITTSQSNEDQLLDLNVEGQLNLLQNSSVESKSIENVTTKISNENFTTKTKGSKVTTIISDNGQTNHSTGSFNFELDTSKLNDSSTSLGKTLEASNNEEVVLKPNNTDEVLVTVNRSENGSHYTASLNPINLVGKIKGNYSDKYVESTTTLTEVDLTQKVAQEDNQEINEELDDDISSPKQSSAVVISTPNFEHLLVSIEETDTPKLDLLNSTDTLLQTSGNEVKVTIGSKIGKINRKGNAEQEVESNQTLSIPQLHSRVKYSNRTGYLSSAETASKNTETSEILLGNLKNTIINETFTAESSKTEGVTKSPIQNTFVFLKQFTPSPNKDDDQLEDDQLDSVTQRKYISLNRLSKSKSSDDEESSKTQTTEDEEEKEEDSDYGDSTERTDSIRSSTRRTYNILNRNRNNEATTESVELEDGEIISSTQSETRRRFGNSNRAGFQFQKTTNSQNEEETEVENENKEAEKTITTTVTTLRRPFNKRPRTRVGNNLENLQRTQINSNINEQINIGGTRTRIGTRIENEDVTESTDNNSTKDITLERIRKPYLVRPSIRPITTSSYITTTATTDESEQYSNAEENTSTRRFRPQIFKNSRVQISTQEEQNQNSNTDDSQSSVNQNRTTKYRQRFSSSRTTVRGGTDNKDLKSDSLQDGVTRRTFQKTYSRSKNAGVVTQEEEDEEEKEVVSSTASSVTLRGRTRFGFRTTSEISSSTPISVDESTTTTQTGRVRQRFGTQSRFRTKFSNTESKSTDSTSFSHTDSQIPSSTLEADVENVSVVGEGESVQVENNENIDRIDGDDTANSFRSRSSLKSTVNNVNRRFQSESTVRERIAAADRQVITSEDNDEHGSVGTQGRRLRVLKFRRPVSNSFAGDDAIEAEKITTSRIDPVNKNSITLRPSVQRRIIVRKRPSTEATTEIETVAESEVPTTALPSTDPTKRIRKIIRRLRPQNTTASSTRITEEEEQFQTKSTYVPIKTENGRTRFKKIEDTKSEVDSVSDTTESLQRGDTFREDGQSTDTNDEYKDATLVENEAPTTTASRTRTYISRGFYKPNRPSVTALTSTEATLSTPRSYIRKYSSNFTLPKPPADKDDGLTKDEKTLLYGRTTSTATRSRFGYTSRTDSTNTANLNQDDKVEEEKQTEDQNEYSEEDEDDDEYDYGSGDNEDEEEQEEVENSTETVTESTDKGESGSNNGNVTNTGRIEVTNIIKTVSETLSTEDSHEHNDEKIDIVSIDNKDNENSQNNDNIDEDGGQIQLISVAQEEPTTVQPDIEDETEIITETYSERTFIGQSVQIDNEEEKVIDNFPTTTLRSILRRPPPRFVPSRPTNRPRLSNSPIFTSSTPNPLTQQRLSTEGEQIQDNNTNRPVPRFRIPKTRTYERKYSTSSTESTPPQNNTLEEINVDALTRRNKKIFESNIRKTFTTATPKYKKQNAQSTVTTLIETQEHQQETDNTGAEVFNESPKLQADNLQDSLLQPTTESPKLSTLHHVFSIEDEADASNLNVPNSTPSSIYGYGGWITERRNQTLVEINRIVEVSSKQKKVKLSGRNQKAQQFEGDLMLEKLPTLDKLGIINRLTLVKLVQLGRNGTQEIVFRNDSLQYSPNIENSNTSESLTTAAQSIPVLSSRADSFDSIVKTATIMPNELEKSNDSEGITIETIQNNDKQSENIMPPESILGVDTSTIALEGLFESERKAKQHEFETRGVVYATSLGEVSSGRLFDEPSQIAVILPQSQAYTGQQLTTTPPPDTPNNLHVDATAELPSQQLSIEKTNTYVRPLLPVLRPESNESSPLVISLPNLDQVTLSKVSKPSENVDIIKHQSLGESNGHNDAVIFHHNSETNADSDSDKSPSEIATEREQNAYLSEIEQITEYSNSS